MVDINKIISTFHVNKIKALNLDIVNVRAYGLL